MEKQKTSRIINSSIKIGLYDPLNFFLYAMLGGEYKFRKQLINYASLKEGQRILDIGCATGANAIAFYRYSHFPIKVYALDAAFSMVQYAKKKAYQASREDNMALFPVQSFAEYLPFRDNSFDKIINVFLLHHLLYEVKIKAITEMYRVLKKGGLLIAVDPAQPYNLLGSFFAFTRSYVPEIGDSLRQPLAELIKKGGFVEVETFDRKLGIFSFVGAKK